VVVLTVFQEWIVVVVEIAVVVVIVAVAINRRDD
jgi:hypothetical protein